jgi:DeoR/GlpR family transcriptional regulator of sugar metabolism
MIEHAQAAIALLDSSKLGQTSFVSVCDLSELDGIVTDDRATAEQLAALDAGETPVYIASTPAVAGAELDASAERDRSPGLRP